MSHKVELEVSDEFYDYFEAAAKVRQVMRDEIIGDSKRVPTLEEMLSALLGERLEGYKRELEAVGHWNLPDDGDVDASLVGGFDVTDEALIKILKEEGMEAAQNAYRRT